MGKKFKVMRGKIVEIGLSIDQFADAVGISRPSMSNKLRGVSKWNYEEMKKIRSYLKDRGIDITVDELFEI